MDRSRGFSHRPQRGYYQSFEDRYREDERGRFDDGRSLRSHSSQASGPYHSNLLEDGTSRCRRRRFRGQGRDRRGGGSNMCSDRRGAASLNSLCEHLEDDRKSRYSDGKCHRKERKFPIGLGELNRLLTLPADVVTVELLSKNSGFQLLLELDKVPDEKFECLIKVLAYSTSAQSNREHMCELFKRTCEQKFIDKICSYIITIKRIYPDKAKDVFTHLYVFLQAFANAMTTIALDRLPNLIDSCISVLTVLQQKAFTTENLLKQYEELQEMLTEAAKRWEQEQKHDAHGRRKQWIEMDDLEPPDDFRELSVLPTPWDLSINERPFLRKNILQGKYKDGEHYLDVQFRLMHEDFIRPLRNGINDFRRNKDYRNRDVRIYRNVSIVRCEIKNRRLVHLVQLNMSKKILIESSKRLMYGNLLCFSNDDFKSLIIASVAGKDPENLKKGIIEVLFETDIQSFDLGRKLVMIESRAFFTPYKHVLKALQSMSGNAVPFSSYVIHIEPNVEPPKYLHEGGKYDLRVIKNSKMMKKTEAYSCFYHVVADIEDPKQDQWINLKDVFVLRDLITWPSEDDLGLDSSQRRALQSALTRQVALIQGPPGTGKTFIGLKIAQILLHNSEFWKTDKQTPILVVCYTNHALDQFLEGMTTFTRNIVRVGARSKSEKVNQFQINLQLRNLREGRRLPSAIHNRNFQLESEVYDLELQIKKLRNSLDMCSNAKGIISMDIFVSEGIVPPYLQSQLEACINDKKLTGWLMFNIKPEDIGAYGNQFQPVQPNTPDKPIVSEQDVSEFTDENNIWEDAEELLGAVECNRQLQEDENDDITDGWNTYLSWLHYETTDSNLSHDMDEAVHALQKDETDSEAYFVYNICAGQREALKIGLTLLESPEICVLEQQQDLNVWNLDFPRRWRLYKYWISKLRDKILEKLRGLESYFQKKAQALEEIRNQKYLYIMRHASVLGMTTTGAAQHNSILKDLAPTIVIIEEAAEILESHVISSLTIDCQHLIMIGDHQQLRPSATVYDLATRYGLETSLFERMIKNGLTYETLEYQHRMKPSISSLLVPSIYPKLKNHPSVDTYPSIKGVTKDVFFISHQIHENEGTDDNSSHENRYEAELLMGLCRHLILQGYLSEDITILTPYSGQFFLLRKIQRQHQACQGVRIHVVDNFQGEENNIILLSLVRSNEEGNVGFLRTDNRVCVALSRAKHGLYITGNMEVLSASSKLWSKVREDLTNMGSIGNFLTLRCQNHPEQLISVSSGKDFLDKSPEGGCLENCYSPLPHCNHTCPRICHIDDQDHKLYKCREPCPKTLCGLDHPCPKKCWEECAPCNILVEKLLPCGHRHSIPCYISPEKYKCPSQVEKEIALCQHKVIMPCHQDPKLFQCPTDCDTRLDCGHKCRNKCHYKKDPDHLSYNCLQSCTRLNAGCTQNHPCQKKCYEDCGACIVKIHKILPCGHNVKNVLCSESPENIKCLEKCKKTLPCGHSCQKLCYQPCQNCPVKVKKVVPECNHSAWIACGLTATTDNCDGPCPKKLPCGHLCLARCNEECTVDCTKPVATTSKCPKGHSIVLPCHLKNKVNGEDAWGYCKEPCNQLLKCEHKCVGNCGSCFQGRLHVSCRRPCKKLLVCGHICQYPCSADCPPCQEQCQWRCKHSQCRRKCGLPCTFCKENCEWKCEHMKCKKPCGEECSRKPCNQACRKKLKCGHSCVGFCGDPCPPLCRICNKEELCESPLLGLEEDDDARFVFLEDCGHTIEVQGLEGWLHQETAEIGMKACPRCGKPIYNNHRYQNLILQTFKAVKAVKSKYFTFLPKVKKKDIALMLQDPEIASRFVSQTRKLQKMLGIGPANIHKQKFVSERELILIQFKVQVLKKATYILKSLSEGKGNLGVGRYSRLYSFHGADQLSEHEKCIQPRMEAIIDRVMEKSDAISSQMVNEVSCELQRLVILPAYWTFQEKFTSSGNASLSKISAQLEKLMDPTIKFDEELDTKVRTLLKESEQYVGSLKITHSEKIMSLQAVGLKQGHWYKCPKEHIYCDTMCQGAMDKSCPYCGALNRGDHQLNNESSVAGEKDNS